jgi:hypothetical protein
MKDYELEFCKALINDTSASDSLFDDVFGNIMYEDYGRDTSRKVRFIKDYLDHENIGHIDKLIVAIGGDSTELLELFDADYDDLQSMKDTEDKWSDSDFADEINDRIEELEEEQAEDDEW